MMSESSYNRSAEVVLRRSRESRQRVECLEKCLQHLAPQHRELLLQRFANKKAPIELSATRGLSIAQMKKGVANLRTCMRKCLDEAEENALPV